MPSETPSGPTLIRNRVDLDGVLLEKGALRYTPAGVPVVEFRLGHVSSQEEAGQMRRVECEMACVAVGPLARLLEDSRPGCAMNATGFAAAKSLKNRQMVLHVNTIEFL